MAEINYIKRGKFQTYWVDAAKSKLFVYKETNN
jgi:hypothetical protein